MEEQSRLLQKSWKGPWLLESEALKELDKIVAEQWEKIEIRRKSLYEKDVKETYKSYKKIYKTVPLPDNIRQQLELHAKESEFAISNKAIDIILSKDHLSSQRVDTFESAFRELALLREIPLGFAVHFTSGDLNARIFVDHNTNKLEIIVAPRDVNEAKELFTVLYNWADKHSVDPLQRFFSSLAKIQPFVLIPYLAAVFLSWTRAQDNELANAKIRATELVNQGISQTNIIEAVEVLLKIETHQTSQIPSWLGPALGVLAYFLLILNLRPKVILGIGRGIPRLKLWKWWLGFIVITFPIFVMVLVATFFGERTLQSLFP